MHSVDWITKVDYTLLEECELKDIEQLCQRAIDLNVKSVCVYPKWVNICSEILKDSAVLVCTVIDFPFGNNSLTHKLEESKNAILSGADELDVVINYKKLNQFEDLLVELKAWAQFCHQYKNKFGQEIVLKVIVESGLLSTEKTRLATMLCIQSGVDYIKTSTGKVAVGAELEKVKVMKSEIIDQDSDLKIKASGGIRTIEQVNDFYPLVQRFGMGYKTVDALIKDSKDA
jgi:deoxyribose-phosphate aldolase